MFRLLSLTSSDPLSNSFNKKEDKIINMSPLYSLFAVSLALFMLLFHSSLAVPVMNSVESRFTTTIENKNDLPGTTGRIMAATPSTVEVAER